MGGCGALVLVPIAETTELETATVVKGRVVEGVISSVQVVVPLEAWGWPGGERDVSSLCLE